jgi:hypothetical protein
MQTGISGIVFHCMAHGLEQMCMANCMPWRQSNLTCVLAGVSAHPIRAALLNIAFGLRIKNLVDVGYFPKVDFPDGLVLSEDARRHVKLHMLRQCLEVLLKEMKELSFTGKS